MPLASSTNAVCVCCIISIQTMSNERWALNVRRFSLPFIYLIAIRLSAYSDSYSTSHLFSNNSVWVRERRCVCPHHTTESFVHTAVCICTVTLSQWYWYEWSKEKKVVSMRVRSFDTHTLESMLTIIVIIVVWAANQTRLPQVMMRLEWVPNNNNRLKSNISMHCNGNRIGSQLSGEFEWWMR